LRQEERGEGLWWREGREEGRGKGEVGGVAPWLLGDRRPCSAVLNKRKHVCYAVPRVPGGRYDIQSIIVQTPDT